MTTQDMIDGQRKGRTYIERLRNDPRTRAMFDGWVAQATMIAGARRPIDNERDAYRLAHESAREAIALAMAFVLDNDGEYAAVCEERDHWRDQLIKQANLRLPTLMATPAEKPDAPA